MADLWDIGKPAKPDVEEAKERFRDRFEENLKAEIPTHPYKLHVEIKNEVNVDLAERKALEELKDEYTPKWQDIKEKATGEGDRK